LTAQHGNLVAEQDHLDGEITAGAPAQSQQLEGSDEGEVEKREGHVPVSSSRAIPGKSLSRYPDDILGTHRLESTFRERGIPGTQ
jgi:hypothetical protein